MVVLIRATKRVQCWLMHRNYLQSEPHPLITLLQLFTAYYGANGLLLIHGMNDENVFFNHTSQLVDCLVGMAKVNQLQVK